MINKKNTKKIFTTVLVSLIILSAILFSISAVSATATAVNLGAADSFTILSYNGITSVPTSDITGNIGVGVAGGGTSLIISCPEVNGAIYSPDAAGPACMVTDSTLLGNALSDLGTAYTNAKGQATDVLDAGSAGEIGGLTLSPGVYTFDTPNAAISTDLYLNGNSTDMWVFQIPGTLTVASNTQIHLIGGAQAKNIFWIVGGSTVIGGGLGTESIFNGNILDQTSIQVITGSTVNGRLFSNTAAIMLDQNTITFPQTSVPVVHPVSPPQNNQGSSGNGGTCAPIWSCSSWSACSNGQQTRTCDNTNTYCSTQVNKPTVSQLCTNANQVTNQNETVTPKTNNSNTIQTTPLTGAAIGTSVGNFFVNTWDAIKGFFVRLFSK